jgi:hypothetical protein
MVATPMLGTNTAEMMSLTVVTPPLGNNSKDIVILVAPTSLLKKSRRSTRKRGHPAAALMKDNHDRDIKETTTKPWKNKFK